MIFNFLKAISCKLKAHRGFSLIEIIVVIAIFSVLAAIGASPLLSFKKTGELNSALETSVSLLLEARAQTLSSENEARYGVHFGYTSAILFNGAAFVESAPENEAAPFPSSVEIGGVALSGGGRDVAFKRLSGETDNYGTIVFRLKSDTAKTRTLRIDKTGIISTE